MSIDDKPPTEMANINNRWFEVKALFVSRVQRAKRPVMEELLPDILDGEWKFAEAVIDFAESKRPR